MVNAVGDDNLVFKDGGVGKHIKVGDIFFERGLKVSKALNMIRLSKIMGYTE